MKKFKKYSHFLLFILFAAVPALYFLTEFLISERHIIHLSADDIIPFIPAFILPYIIWYIYVPLPMVYTAFKDKKQFLFQMYSILTGGFISIIIFIIFPTTVDFRPEVTGNDILSKLCLLIYTNDKPVNVFPSIHCYNAFSVHFTTFVFGGYKNKYVLRVISAIIMVLIALSTVFVKQHSVIDALAGSLFAIIVAFIYKIILFKDLSYNDN